MAIEPRDAATLILLREKKTGSPGKFEVLMVKRHRGNRFAPGAYVFPGGALEEEDYSPEMEAFCRGIDREGASRVLNELRYPERALGFWVAVIRETFEEAGLLMAYDGSGTLPAFESDKGGERYGNLRKILRKGSCAFRDVLAKEGLSLATDGLHYYSHWITPEALPIRFDVRFFVAMAPESQVPFHDGMETTSHLWITPQNALKRYGRNDFPMVLPTLVTMQELSLFSRPCEVIESTRGKVIRGVLTRLEEDKKDGIVEYLPDGRVMKHLVRSVRRSDMEK